MNWLRERSWHLALTAALGLVLAVAGKVSGRLPRGKLAEIKSYVVYYGRGQVKSLAQFDLAILQPDTLTEKELAQLKSKGTKVVAYVSVGEAEPDRPYFKQVSQKAILGKNQDWGSFFVDAGDPGWQRLILSVVIPPLLAKGFDGVFLDTVDTAEAFPETAPGMAGLIQAIHRRFPGILLIQNRGFALLPQVASLLDAVMYEDVSSRYDFGSKKYVKVDVPFTVKMLQGLQTRYGLVVLALDYAEPADTKLIAWDYRRAREFGFIPYVSTIDLDAVYFHDERAILSVAQEVGTATPARGRLVSVPFATGMKLDALFSDWLGIPAHTGFYLNTAILKDRPTKATSFQIAWDGRYIHLAVLCKDQPKAEITARNAADTREWWSDDAVEPYFSFEEGLMIHYAVSPKGVRFLCETSGGHFEAAVKVYAGYWAVEARFPLDGNPLPKPKPGDIWGFKLGREYQMAREFALWPVGGDFSAMDNFGRIVFLGRK